MNAEFYMKDGVLFFHLTKPSIADVNAIPFDFEGPATQAHMDTYSAAYSAYLATVPVTPEPEPQV